MSFFKDFKSDLKQAMNELIPDGNEVYDDNVTSKPATTDEPKAYKKELEQSLLDTEQKDYEDIAPEDMTDNIDALLDKELYSDDQAKMLLDDDLEVNTMDMSVDDLLSQLSAKQEKIQEEAAEVTAPVEPESKPVDTKEDLEALLDSIANGDFNGAEAIENDEQEELAPVENEELNSAVMDEIKETEENNESETVQETQTEEPVMEQMNLADMIAQVAEEPAAEEPTVEEPVAEEPVAEESVVEEPVAEEPAAEEPVAEEPTVEEPAAEEPAVEEPVAEEPAAEEPVAEEPVAEEPTVEEPAVEEPVVEETKAVTAEDIAEEIKKDLEDKVMAEEKDVISIKSVESAPAKAPEEKPFSMDDADTETTYITKGSVIHGDLDTDGSIDVIGRVEGNLTSKGKVVVGGSVTGNITAGELYANGSKIEGDVKSYGSIKLGVGSMVIGNIEGESAVIAGAVNGDIDVKGPVIVDSTAVIMGNIKSRSVQINNGAVLEGFVSQAYSDIDVKSFFA